ncbi:hypothetical protein CEXT_813351 [Caerostris extrusa]|uniref:Uncharacterized protein n=1 Tax=Caerostris extrusa TaxID=172846 RepID=A0AAV4MD18_CAEEX|nr:hypothetical protein CEXT_813351 [Caerostris extrusa]
MKKKKPYRNHKKRERENPFAHLRLSHDYCEVTIPFTMELICPSEQGRRGGEMWRKIIKNVAQLPAINLLSPDNSCSHLPGTKIVDRIGQGIRHSFYS